MNYRITIPLLCVLGVILFCQCQSQTISSVAKQSESSDAKELKKERGKYFALATTSQAEIKISGEVFEAMSAAIDRFKNDTDLKPEEREIQNYDIEMRQSLRNYYFYLNPKLAPGEQLIPGAGTSLGRYVTYEVSKPDFKVTTKIMYK